MLPVLHILKHRPYTVQYTQIIHTVPTYVQNFYAILMGHEHEILKMNKGGIKWIGFYNLMTPNNFGSNLKFSTDC